MFSIVQYCSIMFIYVHTLYMSIPLWYYSIRQELSEGRIILNLFNSRVVLTCIVLFGIILVYFFDFIEQCQSYLPYHRSLRHASHNSAQIWEIALHAFFPKVTARSVSPGWSTMLPFCGGIFFCPQKEPGQLVWQGCQSEGETCKFDLVQLRSLFAAEFW